MNRNSRIVQNCEKKNQFTNNLSARIKILSKNNVFRKIKCGFIGGSVVDLDFQCYQGDICEVDVS